MIVKSLTALLALASTAAAQEVTTNAVLGNTYLIVGTAFPTPYPAAVCAVGFCVNLAGINVNNFATATQFTAVQDQINTINGTLNSRFNAVSGQISRAYELAATAAAMRDAIPNPGDRWALRVNMAGFDGYAAGALGVSVNLTDSMRFSANYGRSQTQNVVSGGLNFSFR